MTCASCANRIERRLNKLTGVSASVNYATETATVDFDAAAVAPEALVAAVESAGYQAVLPTTEPAAADEADETAPLRRPLLRGARQAARRRGTHRPAGAGRQGRRDPRRRRRRAPRPRRAARRRRPVRRAAGREGRHRRHRRGG